MVVFPLQPLDACLYGHDFGALEGLLLAGCGRVLPPSSYVVWCYIVNSCHEHCIMLVNIGHNII